MLYQAGERPPYTGWVKIFHDNGQVKELGPYKRGKMDGLWTWWHEDGTVALTARYKEGEEVKE